MIMKRIYFCNFNFYIFNLFILRFFQLNIIKLKKNYFIKEKFSQITKNDNKTNKLHVILT